MEKAVTCKHEGKRHHFETGSFQSQHTTQPALFRATNSLPRKTRVLRHSRRRYLKANKVSKTEGINKVEYANRFSKCADAADQN